jgi:hypothetical protein
MGAVMMTEVRPGVTRALARPLVERPNKPKPLFGKESTKEIGAPIFFTDYSSCPCHVRAAMARMRRIQTFSPLASELRG